MNAIEDDIRTIFLAALEVAPDQWHAFLDKTCGDNADVRKRVDQLLSTHRAMGSIHGRHAEGEPMHRKLDLEIIEAGMETRLVVAPFERERAVSGFGDSVGGPIAQVRAHRLPPPGMGFHCFSAP